MPNWCDNTVYFSVDPKSNDELGQIVDAVKKGKNKFSLDAVIPMPEVLKKVERGGATTIFGDKTDMWWKPEYVKNPLDATESIIVRDPFPDDGVVPVPIQMREEWKEKYGADNWYDWAYKNWDTKWDTDPEQIQVRVVRLKDHRPTRIIYEFETAWGPPYSVYEKLKKMFPYVDIKWYVSIEDGHEGEGWLK